MSEPQQKEIPQMKPIWYFAGWMLFVIGLIVVASGFINLISPPEQKTVLSHLHPNLWWGATIAVFGLIMSFIHRKTKHDDKNMV